jgi:hypothetical protein
MLAHEAAQGLIAAVPSAYGVAAEDIGAHEPSAANTGRNPGSEGARRAVGVTVLDLPNRSLIAALSSHPGFPLDHPPG